ncbi:ATP-binding protein [Jonesiaceae bacterium BS-20]|uniref:ATP-binding protein n=1 Tax=Jonesiaceae bacterium BS-20 TaxID=3120821 RepID=A0AAU7E0V1_9MICO
MQEDFLHDTPFFPTYVRARFKGGWKDGLIQDVNGGVWLCRAVPMSPVADAKSVQEMADAAEPYFAALQELADMAKPTGNRRGLSKASYRETKAFVVNLPQWWVPPVEHPLAGYLASGFPGNRETRARALILTVKLKDTVGGGGGINAIIDSVVQTFNEDTLPITDFKKDAELVAEAMSRAGLRLPTDDEFRWTQAWWNNGAAPDVYLMPRPDCVHVFPSAADAQAAARALNEGRDLSPNTPTITMAAVSDLDLQYIPGESSKAWWVTQLVDQDALMVTISAKVEPSVVTRHELRRQHRRNEEDIVERKNQQRAERTEQTDHAALLAQVEASYAGPVGAPATLTDVSIVVGFNGYVKDLAALSIGMTATLSPLFERQRAVMAETMLGSNVRVNWHLTEFPIQVAAYSGAPNLATVGDKVSPTTLLMGFSERDKQPCWFDPMAAHDMDTLPITVFAGATGSGKTVFGLWLLDQLARTNRPSVLIDPKPESDHSAAVLATGGQVYSLDSLETSDGAFDPLRFSRTAADGIAIAASMLQSINPWGKRGDDLAVDVISALNFGVQRGATCTGQALQIALAEGAASAELVDPVFKLLDAMPLFRACFGVSPQAAPLRMFNGITLIKVGTADLELPSPGTPPREATLTQRVSLALIRMMVFGSATALSGRDGVVALDEGWIFLGAGPAEVERLGRLARSMRISPMIFTQRVTDALNAGLRGYIARGVILPIEDEEEARAACELFKVDPTPERMARITAPATLGAAGGGVAPNFNSMRALVDPDTREVLRGTIGLVSDLSKRCIPVEIALPQQFLALASTNKADMEARDAARAKAEEVREQAKARPVTLVGSGAGIW